ncbi:NAD/FAD-dependent oxidoreductase [Blastococcus sp. MG754426]|uniref:NAD(P)/FAD-dependent oxidoreductase n=1 Tax=unclassified Blastococcus TaxID=2619396 RepID=UPI001EF07F51|nr:MULTISPECIES: FAD-dependent oxidoreductase [unclassified Blastococcus]MCF6506141.1 NAD/FAD-dependent oxidoreductase [Blastococcus sp. MG754426]MCF6510481.1 NAD/FAD-dependent oxidoreductase [Blastococcus sp. MG754427]
MAPDSSPVTVIGAGIAGLACARVLRDAGRDVQVLDRGRAPGGRLSSRTVRGRPVDLGASYLTAGEGSPFAAVVADWVARGLARPWTDTFAVAGPDGLRDRKSGPMRYGTPGGSRSLATDLASGLPVRSGTTVREVTAGPAVDGRAVPAAVLAMPGPQAARLLDPAGPAGRLAAAETWQPALAVVLGWTGRRWPADLHGAFVHDDPAVEWIADDGDRRGDGAPVLVAHTTAALAAAHLEDPAGAVPAVVSAVRSALGIDAEPGWTDVHRWTFARPAAPREEPFGLADGIGLCGDGWHAPAKVEGAWSSGTALGRALTR